MVLVETFGHIIHAHKRLVFNSSRTQLPRVPSGSEMTKLTLARKQTFVEKKVSKDTITRGLCTWIIIVLENLNIDLPHL